MVMKTKKKFVIVGVISFCMQSVFAAPIEEYFFEPDATYPVHTALGIVTQIELSPKEVIKDFGSGLSKGWELVRRENVFSVSWARHSPSRNRIEEFLRIP